MSGQGQSADANTPVVFPLKGKRVFVAGHRGMVGSALVRRLKHSGCEIVTVERNQLDLRRQRDVETWMDKNRPDAVFIAAATVGGIKANAERPAEFLYNNLAIATNVIEAAHRAKVAKLMFLGAACLYPKFAPQPMTEDSLLEGPPEPTNQWYTVAKIAGVKMCQSYRRQYGSDFITAVPANLYGPGDRFDDSGHVIPGLIMRAEAARRTSQPEFSIWGTGQALREFMHVDDCAESLVFLMERYSDERIINAGTGEEVSIGELAQQVCDTVGYTGRLTFDTTKPDGMPRKLLDSSRILKMGWRPRIALKDGLRETYAWFTAQQSAA